MTVKEKKSRPPRKEYDKAVTIQLVLDSMEFQGMHTQKACDAAEVPFSTFLTWLKDDEKAYERYARARETVLEHMAAQTLQIADSELPVDIHGKIDSGAVQKQKLQIDTRKWLLSKLAPKKYGDKVEVDHTGTVKIDAITRKVVDPAVQVIVDQKFKEIENDSEE